MEKSVPSRKDKEDHAGRRGCRESRASHPRRNMYVHPPLLCFAICVVRVDLCVAKALELFMDRIIKAVASETKARGAKKVTPSHL